MLSKEERKAIAERIGKEFAYTENCEVYEALIGEEIPDNTPCHLAKSNDDDGIKYTCSNCGQFHVKELQLLNGFKYCPVCGARIERNER